MNKVLKIGLKSFGIGLFCAALFMVGQVATYTTLAQIPTTSPGGALNLISDGLMMAFNADSHGTRNWFLAQPIQKPPLTSWSTDDGTGVGVFNTTYGYPYLNAATNGGSDKLFVKYRTDQPVAPYTCKALIKHNDAYAGTFNSTGYGIAFGDNTGKWELIQHTAITASASGYFLLRYFSNSTTLSATDVTIGPSPGTLAYNFTNPVWVVLQNDGTNINVFVSEDGNNLDAEIASVAITAHLAAVTRTGVYINPANAGMAISLLSWKCQ